MFLGTCLLAALAGGGADDKQPAAYPRADMLMEAPELVSVNAAGKYRIFDVRARDRYDAGHVPGAVWIDLGKVAKGGLGDRPELVGKPIMDQAKVGPDTPVVVYDDGDIREAARAWWLLRYWGVKQVRLLNGGWPAWQNAAGKVTNEKTEVAETTGSPSAIPGRLATKNQLLDALKEKRFQIIDARSEKEFCGEARTTPRSGAIPGAIHLEWSDTLNAKTRRFKSSEELASLFKQAGIDPNRPTVTYCQSGGRAAVMAFALELMGAGDVRNYYRSWAEWGNDPDTPIEKPSPRKK